MKQKNVKDVDVKANIIRYMVQDMLDGIAYGHAINLDKFEKDIFKLMKEKLK